MSGQDLIPSESTHALHGMTIDLTGAEVVRAAAAIDLTRDTSSEEEEEEETMAQRVKRRKGRRRAEPHAGSYQDLGTQRRLAAAEAAAMAELVEVRDAPGMDKGLFARRDLAEGELALSYFGRHFPGHSQYIEAFPRDDGGYVMEHRGEFFDGEPIEHLGKYVNHSRSRRNLEFVDDSDSPYVQLLLTRAVRAGEQLFTDYGPSYRYEAHGFTR
eukprot:COSAG04_NODE_412_length_14743_cov_74.925294_6_plen_214_part_00